MNDHTYFGRSGGAGNTLVDLLDGSVVPQGAGMTHIFQEGLGSVQCGGAPVMLAAPEMFPLPQRGKDPYLMNGRSWYYDAEKRGLLRLVRVRKPGNIRGKVYVPYAEARALIRKLAGLGA